MSMIEFRARNSCPLCASRELKDLLVLDGIRIARCTVCGFSFARDMLPPAAIERFYVDSYDDRRRMDGQRVNAKVNADLLRRFFPDLSGKSILDIGSGYGFLLAALRNSGATRVVGIEPSRGERAYATDELKVEMLQQLDDLGSDEQFDIVTSFEVIEHVPMPADFIAAATRRLKVGGSLVVGTDNFTSSVVKALGAQFPKWIPHEHVSLFDPGSLQGVVTASKELTVSGRYSFTPWELLLRKLLFTATAGRKGGKTYSYREETAPRGTRSYRYFALRHAANRLWFKLASRPNLDGEMMYVHATKLRENR